MARLPTLLALHLMLVVASAQPKLLVVLLHEPVRPEEVQATVPFQAAWIVWRRDSPEPLALATGSYERVPRTTSFHLELTLASDESYPTLRMQPSAARQARAFLRQTLATQLEGAGLRGIYLVTPDSPPPSPYATLVLPERGAVRARSFPSLESMRLSFFQIPAEWAVLELKRWDYKTLELLLAEGVEVWLIGIASPKGLVFSRVRLSAVLRFAAREPKGTLTSPATRWNGVVREVDITASLYYSLTKSLSRSSAGVPAFEARQSDWHRFWNGWFVRFALREITAPLGFETRTSALQRSAEWAQAGATVVPILRVALFLIGGAWVSVTTALWRLHRLRGWIRRTLVSGLAVLGLLPAVATLYAYYPFALWTGETTRDIATLASWLVVCWTGLSLVSIGIARWFRVTPLSATTLVALGTVIADTLIAGGYGVNRSLLSSGILDGERIFGINQWFWGYATAASIMLPASWLESRGRTRLTGREQVALGMAYGLLLTVCGLPMLGAALDAIPPLVFALGWSIVLFTGLAPQQLTARYALLLSAGLLLASGVLILGVIGLDSLQPWQQQVGWARKGWESLDWERALLLLAAGIILLLILGYAPSPLRLRLWEHALTLKRALGVAISAACISLLLGKYLAAVVIAVTCVMFVLEYVAGGREWGYAAIGNGAAHQ